MKAFSRNSRLFLALISFFATSITTSFAQGSVAGYDYLGNCGGHHYYISKSYSFGNQISNVVADFQSKTVVPDNQVYAAAIVNAAENSCITNFMVAYNTAKYGNPLAVGFAWRDPRNAWIGFTDIATEGTFLWSNGQPSCENFTNWNIAEPNNFPPMTSTNGEDFTELLIMEPYTHFDGTTAVTPLGKWNDWFNQNILFNDGTILDETKLPVIIEVGPADCPLFRGNDGCSHGYWKNAENKAWTDAGYSRNALFSVVFGITNGRGVISLGSTTLQNGLQLNGGGYNQVAKQGVAALLNAGQGFFPYTTNEVRTAVQFMFNNGTATLAPVTVNGTTYTGITTTNATTFAAYLDKLNNLGCPLNHHGEMSSAIQSSGELAIAEVQKQFSVKVAPNPTTTTFNIQVNGLSNEKVSVRVTDMAGRLVEQRLNVAANQVLTLGSVYRSGVYYVEVIQGANKQQLKLVKQ